MQVQIDRAGTVLAVGDFPTPPADASILVVTIPEDRRDELAAKIAQPGTVKIGPNFTITRVPPTAAELAAAIPPANGRRTAALQRLTTMANGTGANAQVAQAVLDALT